MLTLMWSPTWTPDSTLVANRSIAIGSIVLGDLLSMTGKAALSASVIITAGGLRFSPAHVFIGFVADIDGVKSATASTFGIQSASFPFRQLSSVSDDVLTFSRVIVAPSTLGPSLRLALYWQGQGTGDPEIFSTVNYKLA